MEMVFKKKQKNIEEVAFEISSDNIFADIGVVNAEEELTKAELVWEIDHIIKKGKLGSRKSCKNYGN